MNINVVTAAAGSLTIPDKQAVKIVDLCVLRDAFVDFVLYIRDTYHVKVVYI